MNNLDGNNNSEDTLRHCCFQGLIGALLAALVLASPERLPGAALAEEEPRGRIRLNQTAVVVVPP